MFTIPPEPHPSPSALKTALEAFRKKARQGVRPNDLNARDPAFIERVLPLVGVLYDSYFRCETEFETELPSGAFMAVGNHNAMTGIPDMFCHMVAFWRRYLPQRLAYGLMHDVPFNFPLAGSWLNASGAIAANRDNAHRAFQNDAAVLVFPGGDIDACKPFKKRYSIEFGKRRGFIRTAIREQVPIVPIVSAGAHHSLYILTDGQRIADALGLPKFARSNVAPIGFALPLGIIFGIPYPHIPPPVKIHTRFLKPIHLNLPPSAQNDDHAVEHAFELVKNTMQTALDQLRIEGRHGLFPNRSH